MSGLRQRHCVGTSWSCHKDVVLTTSRRTNSSSSSQWWTPLSGWCLYRPHRSTPSSATLVESSRTDSVPARHSGFQMLQWTAPTYLVDELFQHADRGIRSASTSSLPVRRTRLSTVGDHRRSCWYLEALPRHVTSASSLPIFCSHLKLQMFSMFSIFSGVYSLDFLVPVKWQSLLNTLIDYVTYLLT